MNSFVVKLQEKLSAGGLVGRKEETLSYFQSSWGDEEMFLKHKKTIRLLYKRITPALIPF